MKQIITFFSLITILLFSQQLNAQYFGQNKVKYKDFKFKVVASKTFDTYHYLENDSLIIGIIKDAEKWRARHEQVFKDSFDYKVPIIIYNNHGDFQQTSIVGGLIGTTTGGVTEGLKNRVLFPITPSYTQTDHVLGHELVHAHQYNMIMSADSLSFKNMANIPLWMTEGMAEFLSIGSTDEHTAMWMRDAVAYDYFPRIKDLHKSRYFPYRYGHSFWAFVSGTFGDDKLYDLYKETAKLGVKEAFKRELGMPIDSFSIRWKEATEKHYKPLMENRTLKAIGTTLIDEENGGRMNISPAVSPDGKYFIFLSEKNVFSIELYLANATTGKIIKKLSTRTRESHLDALDGFQSAGTWSPDSKKYAFVVYSKGMNKLAIADIEKGKVIDEFFMPKIEAFNDIDWSPDGKLLLFTGLNQGQSDLYTIDVKTKEINQLTDDYYAQLQGNWSPKGDEIVFVTDKLNKIANRPNKNLSFAFFDVATKKVTIPKVFVNSNNLNPRYSPDGKAIYFLSDREGFRDAYKYDIETGKVYQLTNFQTGISGITAYSPAISISREKNEILYSLYADSKYNIYKVKIADLEPKEIAPDDENHTAAILPSLNLKESYVDANLESDKNLADIGKLSQKEYKPKFKLDYISSGGVGISTGRYGTGMAGGINMLFGDMLNDNQMFIGAMLNGEIQDFGGQVAYLNRKSRYAWGGGVSHIPYRYGYAGYQSQDEMIYGQQSNIKYVIDMYRIFNESVSAFSYYPFSKATRLELGGSLSYYSFTKRREIYHLNNYGYAIGYERGDIEKVGDPFGTANINLAYVGDNSSFGLTAPMKGYRYRLEAQQSFGRYQSASLLGDVRKYFYVKPFTFAVKGYQYLQFGKSAENPLNYPIYLGYGNLVRGYTSTSLTNDTEGSLAYTDLLGSRMSLASFEVRLPFTGPERISVIKSKFLFTDLNLFVDAGVVWGDYRNYDYMTNSYNIANRSFEDSTIISSVGISTRINVFGQLILEPYYAFPLQLNNGDTGVFGLNFTPGW